jgi:hypothetical protein
MKDKIDGGIIPTPIEKTVYFKNKHLSIVGFGNDRQEHDFYPTPEYATEALLEREKFDGNILEPACGDGAISRVLERNEYRVFSSDLYDYGYGNTGIDFLKWNEFAEVNNIITNPPYKIATEFVLKSQDVANKKIAMLLKLVFLESISRFEKIFNPDTLLTIWRLKTVYVFSRRLKIYKNGIIGKNSGLIAYAWFVWEFDYKGKPYIDWIND